MELSISSELLKLAYSIASNGNCGTEEPSTFCLEAMYRSGVLYARKYKATGMMDDLDALETIKRALGSLGSKWRVAGNLPLKCCGFHTRVNGD